MIKRLAAEVNMQPQLVRSYLASVIINNIIEI